MRECLSRVLNAVMIAMNELHYYQGFGDICSVLLIVSGERAAFSMACKLANSHLKDNMAETMEDPMSLIQVTTECSIHR